MLNPKNKETDILDEIENVNDLDDDEILALIQNDGSTSSKKEVATSKNLFEGNECQISLFLFKQNNIFRILMMKIYKHRYFDRFILILIILSSIKLAVDSYFNDLPDEDMRVVVSDYLDLTSTIIFTLEAVVKIVSLGLVFEKGTYLRDSWNFLDFFIVVSTLIDVSISSIDLPVLKILRLLRTLRPLRFISHNKAMKTIVTALLESIGGIANVMVVVLIVWLMFAILGVSFFAGKFFYCSDETYTLSDQKSCEAAGFTWKRYDSNFDDVVQAMMTLYVLASLENWPDLAY